MEYWEVARALEEDPKKKFEAEMNSNDLTVRMTVKKGLGGYYHFEIFNGERLIDQSLGSGGFNGNVCLELDWKPVRQTVTWQEAFEAWAEGKKVVWEDDTDRRVFNRGNPWLSPKNQSHLIDQEGEAVTLGTMCRGTWYVED